MFTCFTRVNHYRQPMKSSLLASEFFYPYHSVINVTQHLPNAFFGENLFWVFIQITQPSLGFRKENQKKKFATFFSLFSTSTLFFWGSFFFELINLFLVFERCHGTINTLLLTLSPQASTMLQVSLILGHFLIKPSATNDADELPTCHGLISCFLQRRRKKESKLKNKKMKTR